MLAEFWRGPCGFAPRDPPKIADVADADDTTGLHETAFEAFGVRGTIAAQSPAVLERMRELLPPGWTPCSPDLVEHRFTLVAGEMGTYTYIKDDEVINRGLELDLALTILDSQMRLVVGVKAPDAIFIHAGVVAHRGRTLVMPGSSFAGKTTLVAALVRLGAVYFSDEFAVIDAEGMIHPYAKPLSLRDAGGYAQTDHPVERLGGVKGDTALPAGIVAVTTYAPGAQWRPERLSSGEGAMALLANAVPARERPAQVMSAIARAIDNAIVLRSDRGEAEGVAPILLAELDRISGDEPGRP
jgi:hypothetical protein